MLRILLNLRMIKLPSFSAAEQPVPPFGQADRRIFYYTSPQHWLVDRILRNFVIILLPFSDNILLEKMNFLWDFPRMLDDALLFML